jgi:hypothetical protein
VEPVPGRDPVFIGKPQGKIPMFEDPFAVRLGIRNLCNFFWLSCEHLKRKAATTDHRLKPSGWE